MTHEIKQAPVPVRHRWGAGREWHYDPRIAERLSTPTEAKWHLSSLPLTVELSNGQRINVRVK